MKSMDAPTPQNKLLDKYLFLTLALLVFAVAPLLYPGYFETHTGYLPLWSISQLRSAPANLTWLPALQTPRFWAGEGLLPYYAAALIPLPPLGAMKFISALSILAAGSGLYLWLKSWIGSHGASVAALVYVYSPFLMAALYARGAWSEVFFWGLLPWALLAATFLVAQPKAPTMVAGVGFWAILGLSQLGLSLWAFLFLAVMLLGFHRPQAKAPIVAASLGVIAAGAITFFKLSGQNNIFSAAGDLSQHLLYPSQLISPFWGFGISQPGWDDGLSLSVGLAAFGLTALSFAIWRGGPDRRPWFFMGAALFTGLLLMPFMAWFWQLPFIASLLNYPWQLLGFATLGLAVMSGVGFRLEPKLRQLPIYAAVIIVILLAMYPNLEPQYTNDPIPAAPQAIYGSDDILLLSHRFVADNPVESTDLKPVEPYIPLAENGPLSSGDTFYLQTRWQALRQPEQNYKIFAHLVDGQGQIIAQVDVFPLDGERLTQSWLPGEFIDDMYTFTLPQNSPSPAQVWLGFYDPKTLERLPVNSDSEGRAILDVK